MKRRAIDGIFVGQVSCRISEIFPWIYSSQGEVFVCLNHHEVRILLDKSNSLALVREEIVADRADTELRFQGLAECPKALFECK